MTPRTSRSILRRRRVTRKKNRNEKPTAGVIAAIWDVASESSPNGFDAEIKPNPVTGVTLASAELICADNPTFIPTTAASSGTIQAMNKNSTMNVAARLGLSSTKYWCARPKYAIVNTPTAIESENRFAPASCS